MSGIVTTGSISSLLSTDPASFDTGDGQTYVLATFAQAFSDAFTGNFTVATQTASYLTGTAGTNSGTMTIHGTNLNNGVSGYVTSATYADGSGHWSLSGSLAWTNTGGVTGGNVTYFDSWDGTTGTTMRGNMHLTGGVLTGTATEIDYHANGLTITYMGSMNAADGSGTVKTVNIHDSSGDSILLTGSYDGATLHSILHSAGSFANALDTASLFTGNDTMTIADAAHAWHGGDGNDRMTGGTGADTMYGDNGNDILTGNAGNDYLDGGAGNDTLNGGTGDDTMVGGTGNDTYYVDSVNDIVSENPGEGTDLVISTISYTLGTDVENLTLSGIAISGTGNALNNIITGDNAANVLDGGTGNDTLNGSGGNDTYIINSTGDLIIDSAGIDLVKASISYTLSSGIEQLTLTGSDNLNGTGNSVANLITGNSGDNILDGKAGADTMIGGGGNDTFIVDNSSDIALENIGGGNDLVISSVSYTLSANIETLTLTGTGNINGTGSVGSNLIIGNSGNNILSDGGGGLDTLVGGVGNDTYIVTNASDLISENTSAGTDLVMTGTNYALGDNVENLTLTGVGNIQGIGNALNNVITGNAGNNFIFGGAGADTMIGGAGNDVYSVDNVGDVVSENAGGGTDVVDASVSYTIAPYVYVENLTLEGNADINGTGNALNNFLTGNVGSNILNAGAGNDTIGDGGGIGTDTMIGGLGNDTYNISNTNDVISENAGEGTDLVNASVSYTLSANVENLTLTGTADLTGTGNTGSNVITGNSGNDLLDDGSGGTDTLIGGTGNDTYNVNNASDVISENVGGGLDLVNASVSYTLGTNVENLVLTGTANINGTGNADNNDITGNSGNNVLNGGAGNDILDGGAGADTLIGGAGNDTYVVDDPGDVVSEISSQGTDLVLSSINYTLTANVENLTLTGTDDLSGTGNALNNIIRGNDGNNVLDGQGGSDTMIGGLGDDTYVLDNTGDVISENANEGTDTVMVGVSYTLSANLENLILTGIGNISGTGNSGDNVITGNDGNNVLTGGGGNDTLIGGLGDDTYVVSDTNDTISENSGEGTDTVLSSVTYTLGDNVENLTLTGTGDISGTGNTDDNIITGNSGNNVLDDGGGGNDTMIGGLGDDTYMVTNSSDIVSENPGEGTDIVISNIDYTLGDNVENLTLTGTDNINGTGNLLSNVIIGNDGNNVLDDSGGGNDTLIGGLGDDTYMVTNTNDVVSENPGEGTDTVISTVTYTLGSDVENLTLTGTTDINGTGNTDDNIITGNDGNNVLDDGSGGNDTLIGGLGDDTYVVSNANDVVSENSGEGTDTVLSSVTYTLGDNVENLTLTGTGDISGTGNTDDNIITGNSGNNVLDDGSGGNDTMIGGLGDDTYMVTNASDVVSEDAGAGTGTDLVMSSVDYTLGANVENLTLTGTDAISGTGNTLSNVITGNDENNVLDDGNGGTDTLIGGLGDDTYNVTNASDVISENSGEGTDLVQASVSYTLGDNIENLTLTGTDDINGTGNSGDNVITGNDGNNVLDGGTGNDTLIGGLGDDTYVVSNVNDIVIENPGEGTDTVLSGIDYTLADDLENLTLTGTDAISGTGNDADNVIIGNSADNVLDGGAGADTMIGGMGNDTYMVDDPGDVVSENPGEGTDTVMSEIDYTLGANVENLVLTGVDNTNGTGNSLDNVLTGNTGDNVLDDGSGGTNTLIGGLGDDTYMVTNTNDVVSESPGEGTDTVISTVTYTLSDNVENLILTGTANINGTGSADDNMLTGNDGNNILDGGAGADTMIGGLGDDTYYVDDYGDVVSENPGEGTDTVYASVSFTLGSDVENLTLTGSDDLSGTGNSGDNIIIGNDGNNVLDDGGGGTDTLIGGLGDDTYIITNVSDVISENPGEGTDTVQTDMNYTLGANLDNLTQTGTDDVSSTGNALDNVITGNDGNDVIDGGAGADTMIGGLGDDTYYVDDIGDVVSENPGEGTDIVYASVTYALGDNVENLTLTGTDNIDGVGNSGDNLIIGNDGNNVLDDGNGGTDTLIGGLGDDTYNVNSTNDIVSENPGEGHDLVQASVSYTLTDNVEDLTLTGTADINGTGNTDDNVITGNDGNNMLDDGGGGNDTLIGGLGDDTYVITNSSDVISENLGEGTDTVQSSVDYTLGLNLENLTLTGTDNLNGTGNADNNVITGNSGDNVLDDGSGGNDTMIGGLGDDTYMVNSSGDVVSENAGEGTDTVITGASYTLEVNVENLTLTGSADLSGTGNDSDNVIIGNDGNNILCGAAGNDTITGGLGADTFMYNGTCVGANITITDFTVADGDALNIKDVLVNYDPATSNLADFVQLTVSGSDTIVSVDRDGPAGVYALTQIATLQGVTGLDAQTMVTDGNLIVS